MTGGVTSWHFLASWEWLLLEGLVLGLAIYELVSIRRELRRSRAAEAAKRAGPPSG